MMHKSITPGIFLLKNLGKWGSIIKLTTFSHVADIEEPMEHFSQELVGYLPPEVLNGDNYTKASDMWALGCLLY